jgi:signal transduction histidine kinase
LEVAPVGSAVRVNGRATAGGIELVVADAGPGMTSAQRARAFDRFWRPTGADRDGGSGLGLAIVQRLVTADGGTVGLDESAEGGLAVRLVLRPS